MSVSSAVVRRRADARPTSPGVLILILVLVLGAARVAAAPRGGATPSVEESTDRELRFSLEVPEPHWERHEMATGAEEWSVGLAGFVGAGRPGGVQVPRHGTWIVVPPGTQPRLETVTESWQPAGGRVLVREPLSVVRGDQESDGVSLSARAWRPGEPLPEGVPADELAALGEPEPALAGRPAARLGDVGWWRGRRVASLLFLPIQVDGDGRAVRTLSRGTWRIRFVPDDKIRTADLPPEVGRKAHKRGDDGFGFLFLNGDQLERWPTEPAARGTAAADTEPRGLVKVRGGHKGAPLGYPDVRLPVSSTRLYRARASQLRNSGLLPRDDILESQIRLYQRRYVPELDTPGATGAPYVEVEVPILMVGDGGNFDDDDFFLFWGLRVRDDREQEFTTDDGTSYLLEGAGDPRELDNDFNIYWLQYADPDPDESWARMEQGELPASAGAPLDSYRRLDHLEENNHYREHTAYDSDGYSTDRLYFNNSREDSLKIGLSMWSPVPEQQDATLDVRAGSFGRTKRYLQFTLLGEQGTYALPSDSTTGLANRTMSLPIPPEALSDPSLTLLVQRNIPGNVSIFVNWIELAYDAAYHTPSGRLLFNGGEANTVNDLEITGFSDDDVGLIEVTDPRRPVFFDLTAANLPAHQGGTKLSLRVDQTGGVQRTFYASQRMTSNGVADVRYLDATLADDPVDPTQVVSDPELLVIVHPEFRAATQRWIDHRVARAGEQGLTVHVLEPQSLYDWYSGGLKTQWALKRFCNHALDAWGATALMLIGDANENGRSVGLPPGGIDYGRDLVPTYHWQDSLGGDYLPEMIATDCWYADRNAVVRNWPANTDGPWDMLVGRFPCNNVDQLNRMIDKTIRMETFQSGESWRRRALFLADDAFSSGTLGAGETLTLSYVSSELAFERSERDSCARYWRENGGQYPLVADTLMMRANMEAIYPDPWGSETIPLGVAKEHCASAAVPPLKTQMSAGAMMVHFQGHGNATVMCHEQWFLDDRTLPQSDANRWDVVDILNTDRPFVFFGMACHLAHWTRQPKTPNDLPRSGSICEKLLGFTAAGAVASYGSSNYERLGPNYTFSNMILRRWTQYPPFRSVAADSGQSRWVLGELIWAGEADVVGSFGYGNYHQMCANYALLGDPLMVLNAGLPETAAFWQGDPDTLAVDEAIELVAVDASNVRNVDLEARDEAGIARVQVLDSTGADLTSQVVTDTGGDGPYDQYKQYQLALPVRPFDHTLSVRVFDTATRLSSDPYVEMVFSVSMPVDWYQVGNSDPIDPSRFVFPPEEPINISASFTSPSYVDQQTVVDVTGQALLLDNVVAQVGADRRIDVSFTAVADPEAPAPRAVLLRIGDVETSYVLEEDQQTGDAATIERLVNHPNPMRDSTHFVFRTSISGGRGRVLVYTVSGRQIVDLPFPIGAGGEVVVSWDGRDREGDRIANGVYLYRVIAEGSTGEAKSSMQRLVVMR